MARATGGGGKRLKGISLLSWGGGGGQNRSENFDHSGVSVHTRCTKKYLHSYENNIYKLQLEGSLRGQKSAKRPPNLSTNIEVMKNGTEEKLRS